jgi:hypothetical protein
VARRDPRVLRRDARSRQPFRERLGRHHRHHCLAHAGRLPLLREIVPDVLAIDGTVSARPGADEIGPHRHDALNEQRSPVVTHQIDGLADALELSDEPLDVRFFRRREARRHGATKAGKRRRQDVAAREEASELVPEAVRVGDAVDEYDGHAPVIVVRRCWNNGRRAAELARHFDGRNLPCAKRTSNRTESASGLTTAGHLRHFLPKELRWNRSSGG